MTSCLGKRMGWGSGSVIGVINIGSYIIITKGGSRILCGKPSFCMFSCYLMKTTFPFVMYKPEHMVLDLRILRPCRSNMSSVFAGVGRSERISVSSAPTIVKPPPFSGESVVRVNAIPSFSSIRIMPPRI